MQARQFIMRDLIAYFLSYLVDYQIRYIFGFLLTYNLKYEEALQIYNELINEYPQTYILYFMRGMIKKDLTRYKEAIKDFDAALPLFSVEQKSISDRNYAHILYTRGLLHLTIFQNNEAIVDLKAAINLNAINYHSHFLIGTAYHRLGERGKAIIHLKKSIRLNPDYPDSHINLGVAHLRIGHIPQAIFHFEEALRIISIHPEVASAYANYAKNLTAKLLDFHKAIQVNPDDNLAYIRRAEVYAHYGKMAEAIIDLNIAISLQTGSYSFNNFECNNQTQTCIKNIKVKALSMRKEKEMEYLSNMESNSASRPQNFLFNMIRTLSDMPFSMLDSILNGMLAYSKSVIDECPSYFPKHTPEQCKYNLFSSPITSHNNHNVSPPCGYITKYNLFSLPITGYNATPISGGNINTTMFAIGR